MKNLIHPCLRRSFILIITIIIKQYISFSQTTFQRILDDTSHATEIGISVLQTNDLGYIILAQAWDFQDGTILIKADDIGNVEWTKFIETKRYNSICHAIDGGYIIAEKGLTKIDSLGNIEWAKSYGGCFNSVQQTIDSGYIAAGGTVNCFGGDVYLIKTDLNGDTIWTRHYGSGIANSVFETYNKGFIMAGVTVAGPGDYDIILLNVDSLGNLLWAKTYGGSDLDMGWHAEQTLDSGFIITGRTNISSLTTSQDIFLIKTDNSGNIQWAKTYDFFSCEYWGYVVHQLDDGGYILLGNLDCLGSGPWAVLLNIDSIGNVRWERFYDDIQIAANNYSMTFDGGYIITGKTMIPPGYNNGIHLLKTDADGGNAGCNESFFNSGVSSVNFLVSSWSFSTSSGAVIATDTINVNSIAIIDSILCLVCSDTPIANFGYVAPITNSTIQFYDSSFIADSWYWDFGDSNNETIQNPIHTYTDTGFYNVCLTVFNNCSSDTLCKIIRIDSVATNIKEYLLKKAVKIYPNPNDGNFQINYQLSEGQKGELTIFNIIGKKLFTYPLVNETGNLKISKEEVLNNGLYFCQIVINNSIVRREKLLIIK